MVYLDFTNKCDKVDHGVLLSKLKNLGIFENHGKWQHSFHTSRHQHVRIPGDISTSDIKLSSVPQGLC